MAGSRSVRVANRDVTVVTGPDGGFAVDGQAVTVTPAGRDAWRVTVAGRAFHVHAAGSLDEPWLVVNGVVVRAEVAAPERSARPRRRQEPEGLLAAPMPATVRAVLVSAGDTVTKGATLLVLEAMKMELPLRTPADGVVKAVHCRAGDLVQPGVPLVEIT